MNRREFSQATACILGAAALGREFAVARGEHFGRGAARSRVRGAAGGEGIDEPRPCDIGHEGVEADLRLERRLRAADDPYWAAPAFGRVGVEQDDEPPRAEVGVVGVPGGIHVGGERVGERREATGRRDDRHLEFVAQPCAADRGDEPVEDGLRRRLYGRDGGHVCRLGAVATVET